MGMSPQSGLPNNNRVGDFDPFATAGGDAGHGQVAGRSARRSGRAQAACSGLSGVSGDMRDLEQAAAGGQRAGEAGAGCVHHAVRHYLGAYLVELGGADVIVFTGGIGENSPTVRAAVCRDLRFRRHRAGSTVERHGQRRSAA